MANRQEAEKEAGLQFYNTHYRNIATDLYAEMRQEIYDPDFGQTGWTTAAEQDRFISWLNLDHDAHVLDVACGSGGPSLRLVRETQCNVIGIDIHEQGISNAIEAAAREGHRERVRFQQLDASRVLPYPDAMFDAVICVDAINQLQNRPAVLAEWSRVLKPGGRVVFTNPITVTGPLSNEEIAIRSSFGFVLFVPPGYDERVIGEAGLDLLSCEDATANMAEIAGRWLQARSAREEALRELEGDAVYESQQTHFTTAERIARERRLSRFTYVAGKPVSTS